MYNDEMNLLALENHSSILAAVKNVHKFCCATPGALLTEGDLQCHLFRELSLIGAFSKPARTQESQISATFIHTQVPWFDAQGKLTVRPDITILDPLHLNVRYRLGSVKAPPSKGFHFDGRAFIFELKFIRGPRGIGETELARIQKDFDKIEKLFSRLEQDGDADHVFCYFVIFSRYKIAYDNLNSVISSHRDTGHWEFLYKSLDVPIPKYR